MTFAGQDGARLGGEVFHAKPHRYCPGVPGLPYVRAVVGYTRCVMPGACAPCHPIPPHLHFTTRSPTP